MSIPLSLPFSLDPLTPPSLFLPLIGRRTWDKVIVSKLLPEVPFLDCAFGELLLVGLE